MSGASGVIGNVICCGQFKLKTMDDIKTILILVEMNDGKVRQVLGNKEMKEACLHLLKKDGVLNVTEETMPIEIDYVAK